MNRENSSSIPDLSVVVALISGRPEYLEACLTALAQQAGPPLMEIVVVYDERIGDIAYFQSKFPSVQFLLGRELSVATRSGWSREHHDELRALGLHHARGKIVALLQDNCVPEGRWCAAMVREHAGPYAAVGGAIENGTNRLLNWAVYFCDFGRYQNPVPRGPAEYLSDCNVSYKRKALEDTARLWKNAYHETTIHGALRSQGETLWLCPDVVVWQQRERMGLGSALRERYVWGRSFAGTRVAESEPGRRLLYTALAFLLPPLLLGRMIANIVRKRRHAAKFVLAFPAMVLLALAWSWGEFIGYLSGRATTVSTIT